jgi:hypothetical protein
MSAAYPALRAVCLRRLGFDPAELSEDELKQRLPEIIRALTSETVAVAKSAVYVHRRAESFGRQIPNAGLEREERLPEPSPDVDDPNRVLHSIFPMEG